jgi:hypothetical protein
MDVQAEVDIAEIEAAAKVTEAKFKKLSESITATSKLIDELLGKVNGRSYNSSLT